MHTLRFCHIILTLTSTKNQHYPAAINPGCGVIQTLKKCFGVWAVERSKAILQKISTGGGNIKIYILIKIVGFENSINGRFCNCESICIAIHS